MQASFEHLSSASSCSSSFSRCCEKKSCGNRNETPSDPVIIDKSVSIMSLIRPHSVSLQIFHQTLHEMQSKLSQKRWQPARHAPFSSQFLQSRRKLTAGCRWCSVAHRELTLIFSPSPRTCQFAASRQSLNFCFCRFVHNNSKHGRRVKREVSESKSQGTTSCSLQ